MTSMPSASSFSVMFRFAAQLAQAELARNMPPGRGVRIVNGRKKGHIELDYYGLDDLNALLDALSLVRIRQDREDYAE